MARWCRLISIAVSSTALVSLSAPPAAALDAHDPADNTPAGATVLVPGYELQSNGLHDLYRYVGAPGEDPVDWFRFDVTAGQAYEFQFMSTSTKIFRLKAAVLEDPAGTPVASFDMAHGTNWNGGVLALRYRAGRAGISYLRVEPADNFPGWPYNDSGYQMFYRRIGMSPDRGKGTMSITGNVIRTSRGDHALVTLRGTPNAELTLYIYDRSGACIMAYYPPGTYWYSLPKLGADGTLLIPYDGTTGNHPLKPGVYWMVATGGLSDSKPFVVARE